ncbi:MAG: GNAT family N-acetyltransferase [Maricaulaceae bacterium]
MLTTCGASGSIRPLSTISPQAAEAAIAAVFGPGRFARAAQRLRERAQSRLDWGCACVAADGSIAGVVQAWAITAGGAPAVFFGPLAVLPNHRRQGVSAGLVRAGLQAARAAGETRAVVFGQLSVFGPLGFVRAQPGRFTPPGWLNPDKLLIQDLRPGAFAGVSGALLGPSAGRALSVPLAPKPQR